MNQHIRLWYEKNRKRCIEFSDLIHDHPELSGEEYYACLMTEAFMREEGFATETYQIPPAKKQNCVIAKWGAGFPVIGIIGEYDALPGLGQESVSYRCQLPGPGHGCGHNLMAAGCASAAVAVKTVMEEERLEGTIVYLACPAEEGKYGKVQMIHKGLFRGLDLCVAWHDGGPFRIAEFIMQAITGMRYEFTGTTSHAACGPEEGRSALDAVQLMNIGAEFLREHIPAETRMHYCITKGGEQPNIVPGYAETVYYIRNQDKRSNREVIDRLNKVADGAAWMTETRVNKVCLGGSAESLLNFTLNKKLYEAARKIPVLEYSAEEWEFAEELYKNVMGSYPQNREGLLASKLEKLKEVPFYTPGSSDITDVSQILPVTQLFGGGTVIGLPGHHWATVAAAGSSIGHKGMLFAGMAIAQFCCDVFRDPDTVKKAWEEFEQSVNEKEPYKIMLSEDM